MALVLALLFAASAYAVSSIAYTACGQDYQVTSWTPSVESGYLTFYYEVEDVACSTLLSNVTVNMPTCQSCSQVGNCYNSNWAAETCCSTPYWQTEDAFLKSQNINASGYKFSNLRFTESGTLRFSITVPKTSTWSYGYLYVSGSSYTKCQVPVPVCSCCAPCPDTCYKPNAATCSCANCTSCTSGMYETSPCTSTSNRVCTNCTSCVAGTYQTQACTASSNRLCSTCNTCVPGVTYQAENCSSTSNRVCTNCTTCVPGMTYQARNCSAAANRLCSTCSTCTPGVTYQAQNCTSVSNRVCNNCTTCSPGVTYEAQACNLTSNRVCTNCTTCASGTYESRACNATTNRICTTCSLCIMLGTTYQNQSCNATSNRVCANCSTCVPGVTYQAQACSSTANRVCNNCSTCVPGVTYQAQNCTATTNRVCNNCTTCVPGVSYRAQACNATANSVCNNCDTCVSGVTYEAQTCNATANRVCNNCSTCVTGLTYEAEACNATNNTVCAACSNCTVDEQLLYACNATHDSVCVPCPVCATCGINSHLINDGLNCSCNSGFVQDLTQVNFTCIPQPCCLDCLACNFNDSEQCVNHDPALCNYSCYPNPAVCTASNISGYSITGPFVTYDSACCGISVPNTCSCFTYDISTTNLVLNTFILGVSCGQLFICAPGLVAPPCLLNVTATNGSAPIFEVISSPDFNTHVGGITLTGLDLSPSGVASANYTLEFQGYLNVSSIPIIFSLSGPASNSELLECFISDIGGPECVSCSTPVPS